MRCHAKTVAEISEEMGTRNAVVPHRTEGGCAAVRSFLLFRFVTRRVILVWRHKDTHLSVRTGAVPSKCTECSHGT